MGPQRATRHPLARISALAAGLVLLITTISYANVFGHDDRRLLTPADGLSAVGIIACNGSSRRPTATLVAPHGGNFGSRGDIIITVAHSFLDDDGHRFAHCSFWPGGHETGAARVVFMMLGTRRPQADWNADWAVAILDRKLGPQYQPLEPLIMFPEEADALRARGRQFMLAGHNGEKGPLMVSTNCGPVRKENADINRFDMRAFNHDCDMMPGWSGGPLMVTLNSRHFIVAVNATEMNPLVTQAGEPYDGRYNANTAVRIDGPFFDAISTLSHSGLPERLPAGNATCRVWMPSPIGPLRC
jgi:protease YdgD